MVDDEPNRPGARGGAGGDEGGLRQGAGDDRLAWDDRFRGAAGGAVWRSAGAAPGHRRSAEQRARPEREPARRRLEESDANAGQPVREAGGVAGRQGEVKMARTWSAT